MNIFEIISKSITAFFLLQLLNVILSTIRSVLTIKGTKIVACFINAVYFAYYTFVIKAISSAEFTIFGMNPILIAAIITFVTNFIGVYIGLRFIEKTKKDTLWLLKVLISSSEYDEFLKDILDTKIYFIRISTEWKQTKAMEIYLFNKEESRLVNSIIKKYKTIRYCHLEANPTLWMNI